MRVCIISAIIALTLTQSCANTAKEKNEVNLVATYSGETSSDVPIGPRLPQYEEITADDQPDHHPENQGRIRFEDDPPRPPVHIGDTDSNNDSPDLNRPGINTNLNNISMGQNDGTADNQFEGEHLHNLHPEISGNTELYNSNVEPVHSVEKSDDSERSDRNEQDIKFEDEIDNLKNSEEEQDSDAEEESGDDANIDAKRITFEDDDKKGDQEPIRKKIRTPRRKPRVQTLHEDTATPNAHNPAMHGYGFPGYPISGYPSYPSPIDPRYPAYPHGYPTPYPGGYPVYPTPYPTPYPAPYPTPAYPGYSPYPQAYPSSYPGYSPYPPYQSADLNPQTNLADQDTQADSKYPAQMYSGGGSGGGTGHGKPASPPYSGPGYEAGYSGYPMQPGYPAYAGYSYADPTGQYGQQRPHPGYQGYYRPQNNPKTLTQRAISAVAEALTSIALFDDKQCVPRLLCEVASGSTVSSPTLQKATAGLGPLLGVLQSYNGVSSSPLFLFGRAAVLGMTTKGNPTSCRYAYPQCPNDPEGLLNYLNNHNGGFFRFFGQPDEPNKQQNLEQFYNNLAGQNGYLMQQQPQPQKQQNYHGYPQSYGQSPYGPQNYRPHYYREQNNYRNSKVMDSMDSELALSNIEERIQNKPAPEADEGIEEDIEEHGSKWAFPDENSNKKREDKPKRQRKEKSRKPVLERPIRGERGGGALKFPDERGPIEDRPDLDRERDFIRQQKGIFFPNENHFNFQPSYQTSTPVNLEEYVFDYKHNFYVKRPKNIKNDDTETVYIVRGNGDPNHPEIVKVRPGQSA